MRAALAGIIYALVVFAAGIVVTLIRLGFLQPEIGPTFASIMELPVILALSWFVSQEVINFQRLGGDVIARIAMGVVGFILLILCEFLLANVLFQKSPGMYVASLLVWPGVLGFIGEIVFAVIPILQHAARRRPVSPGFGLGRKPL
ncbi:MAG TPA: hypothetical protein VG309_10560 [Rhizomicrobium sp.]|jgi:hypothetical protein|nr:hypothetical protein [Rhizomicrobium sp.]